MTITSLQLEKEKTEISIEFDFDKNIVREIAPKMAVYK